MENFAKQGYGQSRVTQGYAAATTNNFLRIFRRNYINSSNRMKLRCLRLHQILDIQSRHLRLWGFLMNASLVINWNRINWIIPIEINSHVLIPQWSYLQLQFDLILTSDYNYCTILFYITFLYRVGVHFAARYAIYDIIFALMRWHLLILFQIE